MDTEISSNKFRLMNQEFSQLNRFDGQTYTSWFNKVKFMLHLLKLAYVLDPNLTPIPVNPISKAGKTMDQQFLYDLEKQNALHRESGELCVGHIKNYLSESVMVSLRT